MTAHRPEVFLPVEAHGSLRLDMPGGQALDLVAEGARLRVDLRGLAETGAMMQGSWRDRVRSLRLASTTLSIYGLTLSLESAGKAVVRFGGNTKPSWIARLMRLGPVHLPLSAIFILLKNRAA